MAAAGLFLILFLIFHLIENLLLFNPDPKAYNSYADFLVSLGPLLYVLELILLAGFLFHIIYGIIVWWEDRKARPIGYAVTKSKGYPSRKSISSMTMFYTGLVIFAFLIFHIITFKYGPGIKEGYSMMVDGKEVRDLYRLVKEAFMNPLIAFGYVVVFVLLGFHLRHAFWSAFQSLGAAHPRYTPIIYKIGVILAILISVGFISIPIWIYFSGGAR